MEYFARGKGSSFFFCLHKVIANRDQISFSSRGVIGAVYCKRGRDEFRMQMISINCKCWTRWLGLKVSASFPLQNTFKRLVHLRRWREKKNTKMANDYQLVILFSQLRSFSLFSIGIVHYTKTITYFLLLIQHQK